MSKFGVESEAETENASSDDVPGADARSRRGRRRGERRRGERRRRERRSRGERLPDGPTIAATRQSIQWFRDPVSFMERNRERYGPVFSVRLGPLKRAAFVADADGIRTILRAPAGSTRSGDANGIFKPVVGENSLLVLDGAEHVEHRRMLMPCFGGLHIRSYERIIEELTNAECERIEAGPEVELQPHMERIALATIMQLTLGLGPGPRAEQLSSLFEPAMELCDSPFTLLPQFRRNALGLSPYARLVKLLARLDVEFFAEIAERRADPEIGVREDMLSLLVAAGSLDDRALRDELMTMLMAGHETTTSALAWTLERLARNPDVLERLLADLDAGREVYLEAVVKEALRQRPVVPILVRKLVHPLEVAGYSFPAGWVLMPCVYLAHREPSVYEDPDAFRPERFLTAQNASNLWIPFGGGGRRCIGAPLATLQMQVVLRTFLRRFAPEPLGADEPARRERFTLTPKHGAKLTLSARA